MIRKSAAIALGLMLVLSAAAALAQTSLTIPQVSDEQLAKEPALTQADINAYMKVMPHMAKGDAAALAKAYKGAGLSDTRFAFVVYKVSLTQAMNMGGSAEELQLAQLPKVLHPTKADRTLVARNQDALNQALAATAQ